MPGKCSTTELPSQPDTTRGREMPSSYRHQPLEPATVNCLREHFCLYLYYKLNIHLQGVGSGKGPSHNTISPFWLCPWPLLQAMACLLHSFRFLGVKSSEWLSLMNFRPLPSLWPPRVGKVTFGLQRMAEGGTQKPSCCSQRRPGKFQRWEHYQEIREEWHSGWNRVQSGRRTRT